MSQSIEIPKWWLNLAKFLLIFTVCVVVIFLFSHWAKDAAFAINNYSYRITFAICYFLSFKALDWLTVSAVVGIVVGLFLKYPLKNYLIILFLSLAAVQYMYVFHPYR